MCLRAVKEKVNGDKAPRRRFAYKLVCADRSAAVRMYRRKYTRGSVHVAAEKRILEDRRTYTGWPEYHYGLHVFQNKQVAEAKVRDGYKVIKVQVSSKDWVADGTTEAVYSKLKVLT